MVRALDDTTRVVRDELEWASTKSYRLNATNIKNSIRQATTVWLRLKKATKPEIDWNAIKTGAEKIDFC